MTRPSTAFNYMILKRAKLGEPTGMTARLRQALADENSKDPHKVAKPHAGLLRAFGAVVKRYGANNFMIPIAAKSVVDAHIEFAELPKRERNRMLSQTATSLRETLKLKL